MWLEAERVGSMAPGVTTPAEAREAMRRRGVRRREPEPLGRFEAGRRLDRLARTHAEVYGTRYGEAFWAMCDRHPALRRAYGGVA
jgi:hypothetical protein